MFSETGSDGDKITSDQKTFLEEAHADNSYLLDAAAFKGSAALLLQLDNITKELDHLRDKILANENCCAANTGKTTITTGQASAITANTAKRGISSSQTSAITANTAKTGISTSQAEAIGANTKKTGITLSQANAITANTAKVSLVGGTTTALSFGEMMTNPPPKGSKNPTYSIVMTAVRSGVSKSVTLNLL